MIEVLPGQANIVYLAAVNRVNGDPITSGTVTFYLVAITGANAGKWWKAADSTWSATEVSAGSGTHKADGHWYTSIVAGAWTRDVRYRAYLKESDSKHVPNGDEVLCRDAAAFSGSGARTISITVTDGTNPLEGVRVRLTNGVSRPVKTTLADGTTTIQVDDATWKLAVTKAGYSYTSATLDDVAISDYDVVVTGDHDLEIVMTGITFAPSDPDKVTGYLYCYSKDGVVEPYVPVELIITAIDDTGHAYDVETRQEVSDGTGLVQFTNLFPGATYRMRRGTQRVWNSLTGDYYSLLTKTVARWLEFTIPDDASGTYELPTIFGHEET